MAHERVRHVFSILLKRHRFWPVLGVLGARQTGKSTLFREQVAKKIGAQYVTLDQKDIRDQASKHPALFLDSFTKAPIIIDEVQKAPDLFDAIKQSVDEKKRPGRFLLTGSTDFSQKVGIRESLTGRIGLIRLYPLTLAECAEKKISESWLTHNNPTPFSLSEVSKRLKYGGLPGICFVRADAERGNAFDAWIDTTCFRDLQQIKKSRLSGELAQDILKALSTCTEPTVAELVKKLRVNTRKILTHLEALETLFVVQRIEPHPLGVGKTHYQLFDSGLASHLGADRKKQMQIWLLHECLAQHEYHGHPVRIKFYISRKGSFVDFVIEKNQQLFAYIVTDEESVSTYTRRTAEAFLKKSPHSLVTIIAPCQSETRFSKQILVKPLGFMA